MIGCARVRSEAPLTTATIAGYFEEQVLRSKNKEEATTRSNTRSGNRPPRLLPLVRAASYLPVMIRPSYIVTTIVGDCWGNQCAPLSRTDCF